LGGIGSTYSSFRKQNRPLHWSVEETKKFYEALRQVGQDFGTMEFFFDNPKRNRKSLKQKFRQESNKNPALIEAALNPKARQKIDLNVFAVQVDKEALRKSRQEREKAYEKTKKAHEARQRKEAEEFAQKQAEEEAAAAAASAAAAAADTTDNGIHEEEDHLEEEIHVDAIVNRGIAGQNSSLFDDTNQFWDEAAKHDVEEVLGPMDDDVGAAGLATVTAEGKQGTLTREQEYGAVGGISLSPPNSKSKKKKKMSFRARKKKPPTKSS
jgi:hypothetical protein